ncbi:MAG: hypothetical protein ABR887_07455 [Methanoregulaceae archaeon]|jgi:hypothetical protein
MRMRLIDTKNKNDTSRLITQDSKNDRQINDGTWNKNLQNECNVIIIDNPNPQPRRDPMTICISAICNNGNVCVISADREITVPAAALEYEHKESKIDILSKTCAVMSSGDALYAAEIIAKTKSVISHGKEVSVISISEKLKDIFIETHQNRAESVFLIPRGLTFKEFKEKGAQQIPQPTYQEIQNLMFNFGINIVDFLVVGVDNTGGHIFRVHYNGVAGGNWLEWCDKIGHREIGTGALHASIHLSLEGQYSGSSLAETVFNVYSAKKVAELAPGVGSKTTDLAVITSQGIRFFDKPAFDVLEDVRGEIKKIKPDLSKLQPFLSEQKTK